jgi:uncharacterized protein (DUF885 family)
MKFFKIFFLVFLGFFIFMDCQGPSEKFSAAEVSESKRILSEVEDAFWTHLVEESIYLRWKKGLEIQRLPDLSYAYAKSEYDFAASLLERIDEVKPHLLSHEEWMDYEVLKWELEIGMDGIAYFWLNFPVTPYSSILPIVHRVFSTFSFADTKDLDRYLILLKKYPFFIAQVEDIIKTQQEKGIIIPKEELELAIPFLMSFVQEGKESFFYVEDKRLEVFEPAISQKFQKQLLEIIPSEINSRLRNLVDFIQAGYLEAAPESVGLWQYPGGKDYYRYLIRYHTTLGLSPEEIHETGLEWVKQNNEKVDEIRQSMGYEGNLAQFLRYLKTDPRFTPKSAKEIGEKLNSYIDAVSAKLSAYFLRMPQVPYGVERLDPELEGAMTFGYYQEPNVNEPRGIYYYNGSYLSNLCTIGAESLIYHELVPGHHFEVAFHGENNRLPAFRREIFHSAYSEGWAEYSSWLGMEMGLYKDPYSLCGRYLADSFFSARLVVDTGMNYIKWPRSRAVKFMQSNLLESDEEIHTETLRYSADIPGQALAYKLGCVKMFELRKKAETALGDKFDIKRFHDAILGCGSLPLPVLECHIDWFIQEELKKR